MSIKKIISAAALAGAFVVTSGVAQARVPADQFFASTDDAAVMDMANSIAECAGFYLAVGAVMEEENYDEAGQEEAAGLAALYMIAAVSLEMMTGASGDTTMDKTFADMDLYTPKVRNGDPVIGEINDYCSSIEEPVMLIGEAALAEE